ncbi:rhamnogalacturonan acetylesterase [Streptomyces scopuliridis]|uniref:Rhamnogalacturonan acetylesterase n=1 Tax=Streptomyces scopuliridis TaxID=452529 RepID=A0ACD4ZJ98_9ACTN|nr:rhamnogalacturonan acetylesterase [Streptomyces scopuliridis]WSB98525.1 rhamnogalacturonan acetylesterase [Streptomyces scopuliridis]WSC07773.1 rhamnogalacturonan acetylesterase [Streptomyces scopuliridis]
MPPTSRRRFLIGTTAALGAGAAATLGLPGTASAAPSAVATLYIASDSTAQTYNSGYYPQAGWGQTLPGFFTSNITVANRAIGGRSSRSFIEQGRLAAIHDVIKPGDYLFVQFGHNDATTGNPERYTSPADYKEYLRNDYIRATRSRGATPVVVTPVSRRSYNESTGQFNVSFPQYVDAAKAVAAEEGVPLVDLSALSRTYLNGVGIEASKNVFLWLNPGQYPNFPNGVQDNTHFQQNGATQMSRLVAQAVARLGLPLSGEVRPTAV